MGWVIFVVLWIMVGVYTLWIYSDSHDRVPAIVTFMCLIFGPIISIIGLVVGIIEYYKAKNN